MERGERKVNIVFRVHPSDRRQLERAAELEARTLSDYVRGVLIPATRRRLAEQTSRAG